jgi:hypothetical protein
LLLEYTSSISIHEISTIKVNFSKGWQNSALISLKFIKNFKLINFKIRENNNTILYFKMKIHVSSSPAFFWTKTTITTKIFIRRCYFCFCSFFLSINIIVVVVVVVDVAQIPLSLIILLLFSQIFIILNHSSYWKFF